MSAVATFGLASRIFFQPIAQRFGMKFQRLEPEVVAMHNAACTVKIYFPPCHGGNSVVICLAPRFKPEWNAEGERGLSWFLQFIGEDYSLSDRAWLFSGGALGPAWRHVAPLTQVLHRFSTATPALWSEFYEFYETSVAARSEKKEAQPGGTDNSGASPLRV